MIKTVTVRKLNMRQKILSSLLVCGSLMFASTGASAAWPERDINITVMYGAGGNTDQLSRALASKLEEELGRTVIVHNRPGGQGTVGPDWVSRQKPDGYNLAIVTGSSIAMAPHTTNARYTPSDFTYIGAFAMPRFGVAVHHDASYGSMQELVDKAQKDEIFMASGAILNSLVLLEL